MVAHSSYPSVSEWILQLQQHLEKIEKFITDMKRKSTELIVFLVVSTLHEFGMFKTLFGTIMIIFHLFFAVTRETDLSSV